MKMAKKRKFIEDHKGFSFVELIVVIAIVAVLTGVSATLFGNLQYANTQAAVESVHSMLEKQRITTMSKEGNWYLYIYKLTDGYFMMMSNQMYDTKSEVANIESGTKICGTGIRISAGSSGTALGDNDMIRISYSRNGIFSDDTKVITASGPADFFDAGTREARIVFTGRASHNVTLYKDTGKNFIDEP